MPDPNNYENKDDFMGACIPMLIDEGKEQDQAVAICSSMWEDKTYMGGNNLRTLSKTDEEIRVANYMVLFGGKDLYDEYFTPNTQFDSDYTKTGMLYVDWEHGLDYEDPEAPQRDDVLGVVDWKTAKVDEKGLWVERVLSRRNDYMAYLEELIEEGLIGTSSEAVPGKVRKTKEGEIQVWPLKRDALTVTPAEPRMMSENAIHALKALSEFQPHLKAYLESKAIADDSDDEGENEDDIDITIIETSNEDGGTKKMTDEVEAIVEERENQSDVAIKELDGRIDSLTKSVEAMLDVLTKSPVAKDSGYVSPDSELDRADKKSFGDFLVAIRTNNVKRLTNVYKTALAEETGATGGYGVPTEYGNLLLDMSREFNALRRAGAMTTVMMGKTKEYPMLDIETAPTAGDTAWAGGATADWTEEAASIGESEPRFKMLTLVNYKLASYSLASNEVYNDFVETLDGIVAREFAKAVGSMEEYAFFRGDGSGKPRGILTSAGVVQITRSAGSTVALADLSDMVAHMLPGSFNSAVWFFSPTVLDQIIQLVSSPLSWMPNMRDNWRQSSLLGYPWYTVGGLPALGTSGDILLVDPNYYLIGDHHAGMSIAFSPHYKFVNDQVAWRVTKRVGGMPLIESAPYLEDGSTQVSPYVKLS